MPRIETTSGVKIALYLLRIYLIVMLLLIVVKFLRIFPPKPPEPRRAEVSALHTPGVAGSVAPRSGSRC
jgi:hypothetical protein